MKEVLDHVPALVKTYGKWPSFMVLLLASGNAIGGLALVIALHVVLR